MNTVGQEGALGRGSGFSCLEENGNRSYKCSWWYCRWALTDPEYDKLGALVHHGQPCKTNACPDCVSHNFDLIVQTLEIVQPKVMVTVNHVGDSRKTAVGRVKKMRRFWRERCGLDFQTAYVLEHHVQGAAGDLHAHILGHGELPSMHQVEAAASWAGVSLDAANTLHIQPLHYAHGLTYLFKETDTEAGLRAYRAANGRSLLNTTSGFWRAPGEPPAPGGHAGLRREHRGGHRG